jgi:tRNA G18 (ribose-2'-O)-methylase SpoU
MSRRRLRVEKAARHEQMLQRYEKQRVRNRLAAPGPYPLALVLDGLKAGYNVAKIFRSALAMGAGAIHLVDIGPFDPAPAKGAFRKVPAHFHDRFATAHDTLEAAGYQLFAFTPSASALLPETPLPLHSAFIFGHEEQGLSFDPAAYPGIRQLRIPQAGAMQSLNVSIAASIAMYEYLRQHRERP